jgi:chromosome segregation ATPase
MGGTQVTRLGCRFAAALVLCAGLPSVSLAADARYPDWPCVQAKVPDISVAAVWDGPPIEPAADTWQNEPEIKDLVARLAARRTSLEEAHKSIVQFLTGDAAEKADKGKRLFAGLFETLNGQRTEIMNGLERLARSEKELAEQIRSDTMALHELQDKSPPDQSKIDELAAKIGWSTRIFEDRRKSIRFACEVPVIIEKRLFALSRTIQQRAE